MPVLWSGPAERADLAALIGPSTAKSERWRASLLARCAAEGLDPARVQAQTEASDLMEGLYVKVETVEATVGRYKLVRGGFTQSVSDGDGHWLGRPILPNGPRPGTDIFDPAASCFEPAAPFAR